MSSQRERDTGRIGDHQGRPPARNPQTASRRETKEAVHELGVQLDGVRLTYTSLHKSNERREEERNVQSQSNAISTDSEPMTTVLGTRLQPAKRYTSRPSASAASTRKQGDHSLQDTNGTKSSGHDNGHDSAKSQTSNGSSSSKKDDANCDRDNNTAQISRSKTAICLSDDGGDYDDDDEYFAKPKYTNLAAALGKDEDKCAKQRKQDVAAAQGQNARTSKNNVAAAASAANGGPRETSDFEDFFACCKDDGENEAEVLLALLPKYSGDMFDMTLVCSHFEDAYIVPFVNKVDQAIRSQLLKFCRSIYDHAGKGVFDAVGRTDQKINEIAAHSIIDASKKRTFVVDFLGTARTLIFLKRQLWVLLRESNCVQPAAAGAELRPQDQLVQAMKTVKLMDVLPKPPFCLNNSQQQCIPVSIHHPSKVKKLLVANAKYNRMLQAGPVMLNRFRALQPTLQHLISLDIEAYEFEHSILLEIGYSLFNLSTRTLETVHLIIKDNLHYHNGRLVRDNRDNFCFGESLIVSKTDATTVLLRLMNLPDSAIVGHSISSDFEFLHNAGLHNLPKLPVFDTQVLFCEMKVNKSRQSLAALLDYYDIVPESLHNAGNDAHYTMQVFLRMVEMH